MRVLEMIRRIGEGIPMSKKKEDWVARVSEDEVNVVWSVFTFCYPEAI